MFKWMENERKENREKIKFYYLLEQKCKRKEKKNLITNDNLTSKQIYTYKFFFSEFLIEY